MSDFEISYNDIFYNYTHQILQSFENHENIDLDSGTYFDFTIQERDGKNKKKINPMIRRASPEDVDEIIFIYKDIYENTYPYKEMEDRDHILEMLNSPSVEWLIFETKEREIVGCYTFILDFINKMGYIRGFVIKKKFIGKLDIIKMAMGSCVAMYYKYNNRIFRWYGECRTAHSKSQYFCSAGGFKPIAFYPCKDVFYNKIESDLLIVSYDERALREFRSTQVPTILPEIKNQFLFSDKRYSLGKYKILDSKLILDQKKVNKLKKNLHVHTSKDRFGYMDIKFTLKDSNSFFSFLYTPQVQNFEKTRYKINSLEELFVFGQLFQEYRIKYNVRYLEVFVSAYNPTHQKIFFNLGLIPQGYIPSWKYNPIKDSFEDFVLFNYADTDIDTTMHLLDEGIELLRVLKYQVPGKIISEQVTKESPVSITGLYLEGEELSRKGGLQKKLSLLFHKYIRPTLGIGIIGYVLLISISIIIASYVGSMGYNLFEHTISELGLSLITPLPHLFDSACILAGIIAFPYYFYLRKKMISETGDNVLLQSTMLIGFIGGIGYFFVGVFSLERSGPFYIVHEIFAICAFMGFVASIILFSVYIIRFQDKFPKSFGIFGAVFPLLFLILYGAFGIPILEWLLLTSILIFSVPLSLWALLR